MQLSLIFGGRSYEHEISIVSAISLAKKLDHIEHFIFLDHEHHFYLIPQDKMRSDTFSKRKYEQYQKLYLTQGDFFLPRFFGSKIFGSKRLKIQKLLSLVHGGDGEDGILSSLLEFYQIPFIAPRKEACVLSYDKELTKIYAKSRGVKVLPFDVLFLQDPPKEVQNYPLILKPARLGSSIGVGIVRNQEEMDYRLDCAFEYDTKILIEPFIEGVREYNLAGCKDIDGNFIFSIVEEPQKGEFLDFENKYLDFSRTNQALQAQISHELEEALQENFIRLYDNCFEGSLIRCDFFVIDGEVYLNEINPIPGSMANYLFEDFQSVLERIALPHRREMSENYAYIHKIQKAKGKV